MGNQSREPDTNVELTTPTSTGPPTMLDIFYDTLGAFEADCEACGLSADALLASGEYVTLADGGIIASSML